MFSVDNMSRTPVYEQIINQVEKFISVGLLSGGDQMPSVRSLSMELSVNPNTIQKAFSELMNRGLMVSVPGKGSFISSQAKELLDKKARTKTDDFTLMAKKLMNAGVSEEELIALVKEAAKALAQSGNSEKEEGGESL